LLAQKYFKTRGCVMIQLQSPLLTVPSGSAISWQISIRRLVTFGLGVSAFCLVCPVVLLGWNPTVYVNELYGQALFMSGKDIVRDVPAHPFRADTKPAHEADSTGTVSLLQAQRCSRDSFNGGSIPMLSIIGGPPRLARDIDWKARVCTPLYPGPNCSNSTSWSGKVTLCIGGHEIHHVVMKTRGHVSLLFPKHQFNLHLEHAVGLLGMAPAKHWILGTSFVDTSFQRNPLAFDLYRNLGGWATHVQFVNVQWDGADFGLYYIGEKLEVAPGRVPNPGPGGALMVVDWKKPGAVAIKSKETSTYFNIDYPKKKKITPELEHSLQELVDKVEVHCTPPNGTGSQWLPLDNVLDLQSFARYFIVEELAKDLDGYAFSDFVLARDGKLFSAAPWDFDLGFGFACMAVYYNNSVTHQVDFGSGGWMVENSRDLALWIGKYGNPGGSVMHFGLNKRAFFLKIWRHPQFQSAFKRMWEQSRTGVMSDQALISMISERSSKIAPHASRDLEIWHKADRCAFWTCCHSDGHDFAKATDDLLNYLLARARWIDIHVKQLGHG